MHGCFALYWIHFAFFFYLQHEKNNNKMNSENRQRVRKFTLEEVIEKVINIDPDDESLADALETLSDVSLDDEDDEDSVTPEVTRCLVKCIESALDETSYNECESSIIADDVVYEWTQGHVARH